jgi:hypothetical protein
VRGRFLSPLCKQGANSNDLRLAISSNCKPVVPF